MTTLMPDLDGPAVLLAEWRIWLHGDPRYCDPDVPPPRCIERHRDALRDLADHQHQAHQEATDV